MRAIETTPHPLVPRLVGLILFCGTLLLFSRCLTAEFVCYDDPDYITENAQVQAGLTWTGIKWAFTTMDAANWHPLTWLSHMLDSQLFGQAPAGHHATNIILHALNTVLVFVVFRRLTHTFWLAAFFAAFFAWHPLRVESVAWVSERKDVLSAFFFLGALWFYILQVESRSSASPRRRFYFIALLAFVLGLLSKPMLVTFPCVLLLLDFWPFQRLDLSAPRSWLAPLREKIPFFVLSTVSCILTYIAQHRGGSVADGDILTLDLRAANAVISVARYLGKIFWPFDLAVFYPHPTHWAPLAIGLSTALFVIIGAFALWSQRTRPGVFVGWLWFLGMLVPVLGLIQVGSQSMADRYTYLPVLGLQFGLLSLLPPVISPTIRSFLFPAAALLLIGCAVRTWEQTGIWKSSSTLFNHALEVAPDSNVAPAHNNLGIIIAQTGRLTEALHHFQKSVEFQPSNPEARNNLGNVLLELDRIDEAIAQYHIAIRLRPDYPAAHNNLGEALVKLGRRPEAIVCFKEALRLKPGYPTPLKNLENLEAKP